MEQEMPTRFRAQLGESLVAFANSCPRPDQPAPRRRRFARRRVVIVGAVAGCAVIVTSALLALSPSTVNSPPRADAAVALRKAASSVLRQPSNELGPGRYWYTDGVEWVSHPRATIRYEQWIARNGQGIDRVITGAQRRVQVTRLRPSARPFDFGSGSNGLSYAQLRALPTDARALTARLNKIAGGQQAALLRTAGSLVEGRAGRAYLLFTLIRSAFEDPTSPGLRAALYRMMAHLPGIQFDGVLRDSTGRRGVGISVVLGYSRFRIIIDPATGQLYEAQRMLLRRPGFARLYPGFPAGMYLRYTVLAARVVDRLPR